MTLKEYLTCDNQDELTRRLMKLDASIMALHKNGFYVVNFDVNNIQLYNEELTLSSFNNKIDYLNSGINPNGDKKDIVELCAVGICAYNGFNTFYTNKEFLAYLFENLPIFKDNGRIPTDIYEYYKSVLMEGNIDYLNNYIFKKNNNLSSGNSQSSSNAYKLTKSTAIGRAFAEKNESAYVSVLIIPAIMVLVYLVIFVTTMIMN